MAAPRREQAYDSVSVPKGETVDERDARMDMRYTFDREGDSVQVYISRCAYELAQEFRVWHRSHGNGMGVRDPLAQRRFEQERFGDELYPSAAGILRHAIHRLTFPADFPNLPPVIVATGQATREAPAMQRFDRALDALAERMEMPEPERQSNAAKNRRESQLIGQAEAIGPEGNWRATDEPAA